MAYKSKYTAAQIEEKLDTVTNLAGQETPLPLESGWSDSSIFPSVCRKCADGMVTVNFSVKKDSAIVSDEVFATLPVGYRPASPVSCVATNGADLFMIKMYGSGALQVSTGTAKYTSLSGFIVFKTAQ